MNNSERKYPPTFVGLRDIIYVYPDDYLRVKHAGMFGEEIPVDIIDSYLGHDKATHQLEEAYQYGCRLRKKNRFLNALYKKRIEELENPPTHP